MLDTNPVSMSYISLNFVRILWMQAVFRIRSILMRNRICGSASGNSGSDKQIPIIFFWMFFMSLLFMCTKQKSVLITIFFATRIRIHISWSGSGSETQDAGLISFLSKTFPYKFWFLCLELNSFLKKILLPCPVRNAGH